jgi:signal transduction histidine kinase
MHRSILTINIRYEHDVVLARQRARQIAGLVGFDLQDQTRISTSISELARNVFQYAGSGRVEFGLDETAEGWSLSVNVTDKGPGIRELEAILHGRYVSSTGMGLGILGARRLMDSFSIQSEPGEGTTVSISKTIPTKNGFFVPDPSRISFELSKRAPQSPYDELQQQNQELLRALAELRRRQDELARLNRELEDTNRGVVALYAELDERADYLQRANELKTAFLSNMTHEFRTPLNAIQSLTNLLLDRTDGDLQAEQEKQVLFIRRSAEDLSELVNDLLDLAKVEAGKITLRPQEFKVDALFGTLRGMLRPMLAYNSSVSLVFDPADHIPAMNTDDRRVSQVLRNLISNALKFTAEGEVRVRAEQVSLERIRFVVSDTGIGIGEADLERIFEEWVQLDNPLQRSVKGTGLGLPLSRRLAQLLGGSLTVDSKPGVGSNFYFTVPATYMISDESTDKSVPELDRKQQMRREMSLSAAEPNILIVDDDEISRYLLRNVLSGVPALIGEASNGMEALRLVSERKPKLIFLDIVMPDLSGMEVLERLWASGSRDIPVVLHTSKVLSEEELTDLKTKTVDVIPKAVSRDELNRRVRDVLVRVGVTADSRREER